MDEVLREHAKWWAEVGQGMSAERQALKLTEEVGELAAGLYRKRPAAIFDGIGDTLITLFGLAKLVGLDAQTCLEYAWRQVKYRTASRVQDAS